MSNDKINECWDNFDWAGVESCDHYDRFASVTA